MTKTTQRQARNSRFQKGSGMFACESCGRNARDTGVQSHGTKCCEQCYELAGIENGISDGSPQSDYQNDINHYASTLLDKGVSMETIKREFSWTIDWSVFTRIGADKPVKGGIIIPAQPEGERYTVHTKMEYWNSEKALSHLDKLKAANEARRAEKLAKKAK